MNSKESSATARAKRKIVVKEKNINTRAHKRLNSRSNTFPTISSLPISNTSTPLTDISNTNQRNDEHHNNTQPNSSQFNLNGKQKTVHPQPRTTINLLQKFSAAMENIASTSHSNTHGSNVHTNVSEDVNEFHDRDDEMYNNDDNVNDNNDDDCEGDSNSDYQSESDSDVDDIQGGPPNQQLFQEYDDIGDPIWECPHCGACMWYQERKNKSRDTTIPVFQLCCANDKVELPPLRPPPPILQHLLFDQTSPHSKLFQKNARVYNSMFSFTSPGMKMDDRVNGGRGPPNLVIQGQTCHRMGSMLPQPEI